MTRAVILRRRAEDDIRMAHQWYEGQDPRLGDEFVIEVRGALERISNFPASSPVVHSKVRRASVRRFPYLVFYVVEAHRVVILAILHSSRNPALWPTR